MTWSLKLFFFLILILFNYETCVVPFCGICFIETIIISFGFFYFPVTIESNHTASKKELSRKPDAVLVLPIHSEPQRHDFADSPVHICCISDPQTNCRANSGPLQTHHNSNRTWKLNECAASFFLSLLCSVSSLVVGFFVFQVIYPHHSKLSEKEVSHTEWFNVVYMSQTCCVLFVNSWKTALLNADYIIIFWPLWPFILSGFPIVFLLSVFVFWVLMQCSCLTDTNKILCVRFRKPASVTSPSPTPTQVSSCSFCTFDQIFMTAACELRALLIKVLCFR